MDIILTFIPALKTETKFETLDAPPLALYVLASVLKKSGHKITVIDPCEYLIYDGKPNLDKMCLELLIKKTELKADLIAFSCNTFNWGITKDVINNIRKVDKKVLVALGGLHPSIFDKHVLEITEANFVIRGEGEKSFPNLLEALEKGYDLNTVSGITYRENGEIIRTTDNVALDTAFLETVPLPEYSLIPKINPYTSYPIESSRGCAFSCAFCSIPHRHNWRAYSADNVVKRVEYLYDTIGESCKKHLMLFVDDCFTINTKRAIDIFRKLYQKYRYELRYFIEVRISDIVKQNLFSHIPVDLIESMQIGVECGYDEGLKKIHKEITVAQLKEAMNLVKINGYASKCFLSFIIGFPWETEKEIDQTLETVKYIASVYHVTCNINWLIFLPSDLWKIKSEYNIDVDETIFDNAIWLNDRDIFEKVHPLMDRETVQRIEKKIYTMSEHGLPVLFNSAPELRPH